MRNATDNLEGEKMTKCVKCGEPAVWVVTFRGMGRVRRFFCEAHVPAIGQSFQKMLVDAIRKAGGK